MQDKKLASLINKLERQIQDHNLTTINKFEYLYSVFKINSTMGQDLQELFLEFLKSKDVFLPHEIANFFLSNNMKFSIHFKYIKEAGIKSNLNMFLSINDVKKQLHKINKKHEFKFYTKKFTDDKKNKEFRQLALDIINKKDITITKLSLDLNLLWKPRYKRIEDYSMTMDEYSWLCFQIIKSRLKE